jgi:hypothetical protein
LTALRTTNGQVDNFGGKKIAVKSGDHCCFGTETVFYGFLVWKINFTIMFTFTSSPSFPYFPSWVEQQRLHPQ